MTYKTGKTVMICALLAAAGTAGAQQSTLDYGIKMYNYRKLQSAERVLAPLAPSNALANYYLGLTYLDEGDVAKANATFIKYPDDPANISGTARVAFANKDVNKGMQIARDLAAKAKKKEWQPMEYAAEAVGYSDGGDYTQAITWYKDVLTKNDAAPVHIALGDAYMKLPTGGGDAMNNYEWVTEKDPHNSLAYYRIGDLWYAARTYESALSNYAKAKDADSTNPLTYKSLAYANERSGHFKAGLSNMKKYYQYSDSTIKDKQELLEAMYNAQSSCEAVAYAKDLLRSGQLKGDAKTEVYGILGYSQADCGDSVEALNNLRTYFQMQKPQNIKSGDYINMGKLFLKLGQLDSAGYYYTRGISGDTSQNKTDVYRQIAEAFRMKKDYVKSAEWYTNLVKANPHTQALDYTWRGIMYYYSKDYTNAMNAFDEFHNQYTDQPYAVYWQGRTQMAIDSEATTGAAVPYFTKWLEQVGGDKYEKKNDLKGVYEYLLFYYYNKKEKENMNIYKEKIKAIDPQDKNLLQIEEMEKSPAKGAPAKKPVKK